MSLFSWFTRKPAPAKPRSPAEPSGLLNADATVPFQPGRQGKPLVQPLAPEHAANRKNERMERRELLYTVVRDAMVRAGVLSASYKFKVLSLDQRGRQFLVMMDLAREYGGETVRLSEIEALIAQTAKTRYDILVTSVYWRINDHVAVGIPQNAATLQRPAAHSAVAPLPVRPPAPTAPTATGAPARPAVRPAPVVRPVPAAFDPIAADEVAAFKKALGAAERPGAPGVSVRTGPLRRPPIEDFADTEMPPGDVRGPDLSGTQYGDL